MKEITVKVKAFSSDKRTTTNRIRVENDNTISVFDSVAGHFTTCHIISPRIIKRLIQQAR